jgi:uncharacterized protein affecting Mg2+/Co2+ transport
LLLLVVVYVFDFLLLLSKHFFLGLPHARSGTLASRMWQIQDSNGMIECVRGAGYVFCLKNNNDFDQPFVFNSNFCRVVGFYPVIKPGSHFQYVSCCPMSENGRMGGID